MYLSMMFLVKISLKNAHPNLYNTAVYTTVENPVITGKWLKIESWYVSCMGCSPVKFMGNKNLYSNLSAKNPAWHPPLPKGPPKWGFFPFLPLFRLFRAPILIPNVPNAYNCFFKVTSRFWYAVNYLRLLWDPHSVCRGFKRACNWVFLPFLEFFWRKLRSSMFLII